MAWRFRASKEALRMRLLLEIDGLHSADEAIYSFVLFMAFLFLFSICFFFSFQNFFYVRFLHVLFLLLH